MTIKEQFHHVTLSGERHFIASLEQGGPYLTRLDNGIRSADGIYLGDIAVITQVRKSVMMHGWQICEYDGRHPRIDLSDLSDEQVRSIADEFGIQMDGESLRVSFYGSNAWNRLKAWVHDNPQRANQLGQSQLSKCYVGDWHSRALVESKPVEVLSNVKEGSSNFTSVEIAEEIINEVDETTEMLLATKLARDALKISPLCVEAYNILAYHAPYRSFQALSYWNRGVEAGEKLLGTNSFQKYCGEFWGLVHTRPYMRAKHGLALCLLSMNDRFEAIKHLEDMLRLNPIDNQGARYALLPALLLNGDNERAKTLIDAYHWDHSPRWLWNVALAEYCRSDENADASLKRAIAANKYVVPYLIGKRRVPHMREQAEGAVWEAHNYAAEAAYAWRSISGARQWLNRVSATIEANESPSDGHKPR